MIKLKKIVWFLSLFCFCFLVVKAFTNGNLLLSLIPISFGIVYRYIIPNKVILGSGFAIFSLVSAIRYLLYPILFEEQLIRSYLLPYLNLAIIITIIELFAIALSIRWYYKNKTVNQISPIHNSNYPSIIPICFCLYLAYIIIFKSNTFANLHFILSPEGISEERIDTNVTGITSQFAFWGRIIVIPYLFYIFQRKYYKTKSTIYYIISIFIILFPCLFYSGASRLSLLMPIVCATFIIKKVYPQKADKLVIILLIYGVIALGILSLQKFWGVTVLNNESKDLISDNTSRLLNSYFGGLENIAIGLKAYSEVESSLLILINDSLRNAMGISQYFFDAPCNSVTIFNRYYYNYNISFEGDQICPTIIEGLLIFGPFLCFLLSIIMSRTMCWLDYNYHRTNNIYLAYLYAFVGSIIGWAIPGNFMHLTSNFINVFLPIFFILKINNILRFRYNGK